MSLVGRDCSCSELHAGDEGSGKLSVTDGDSVNLHSAIVMGDSQCCERIVEGLLGLDRAAAASALVNARDCSSRARPLSAWMRGDR